MSCTSFPHFKSNTCLATLSWSLKLQKEGLIFLSIYIFQFDHIALKTNLSAMFCLHTRNAQCYTYFAKICMSYTLHFYYEDKTWLITLFFKSQWYLIKLKNIYEKLIETFLLQVQRPRKCGRASVGSKMRKTGTAHKAWFLGSALFICLRCQCLETISIME